ncbi:hypothetical protein CERSUDRAFT_115680 [Gelatoporia subvermispora B]|uniref:MSP domain-containing protein n=1 Tax=Ceriporiopsis subvermispora (strain B) TaxID=914234 RepID=M2RAA2_CERS8|nr:hypothetical protein CERSUDRAFT_115680 [Gelatoporia subvermispora B]
MSIKVPYTLELPRPLTKRCELPLPITNYSGQTVAFKVLSNNNQMAIIRPNMGIIEPGQTLEIQVRRKGLATEPPEGFQCRDRLKILSMDVPPDAASTLDLRHLKWNDPSGLVHEHKVSMVFQSHTDYMSSWKGKEPIRGSIDSLASTQTDSEMSKNLARAYMHQRHVSNHDDKDSLLEYGDERSMEKRISVPPAYEHTMNGGTYDIKSGFPVQTYRPRPIRKLPTPPVAHANINSLTQFSATPLGSNVGSGYTDDHSDVEADILELQSMISDLTSTSDSFSDVACRY